MQSGHLALPFEIIADHPRYLAVHKAPGISFHSEDSQKGLLNMLREQEAYSEKESIDSAKRLFPVHRLDRVTSGILLFARGRKNADLIGSLFRHRRIEKNISGSFRPQGKKEIWDYNWRHAACTARSLAFDA